MLELQRVTFMVQDAITDKTNDTIAKKPIFGTDTDYIDPEVWLIVEKQRVSKEATKVLLQGTEEILGVSARGLARLMGIGADEYSRRKNGHVRFGSGRLAQIIKLLQLHARGVPLNLARSIYWKEGIINWRNGNVSSANHLLERGWEVPDEEGESDARTSPALTQWGRQAGPQPKRKSGVRPGGRPAVHEEADANDPVG